MTKKKKTPNQLKKIEERKAVQAQVKKEKNRELFLLVFTVLITALIMPLVERLAGFSYNMATDGFGFNMVIDLVVWMGLAAIIYVALKKGMDYKDKKKAANNE